MVDRNSHIVGVQVGKVRQHKANPDVTYATAFVKNPVTTSVFVHEGGLTGDEQADRRYHGGVDKAVLGYSQEQLKMWEQRYNRPFVPGAFGENLTFSDLSEDSVCIGDQFQIGGHLLLEVSQPRIPCWKISSCHELDELTSDVRETGATGWYFRVLREGEVTVGDAVQLKVRPYPELSIHRLNRLFHQSENMELIPKLQQCERAAPNFMSLF